MIATRRRTWLIGLFSLLTPICFANISCNNAGDAGVNFDKPQPGPTASAGATADPNQGMPEAPKDAEFTIFCRVFGGDNHAQDARLAQEQLRNVTNLKKWYVVHSKEYSTLYYGFYRCINPRDEHDAAEGQRAIDDQNTIRSITDSGNHRLFPESLLVGVVAPDPQANPAWDITRTRGTWSIEIGAFTTAHRKMDAVEAVKEARSEGIEAYYYHGDTASSVCVGCWPAQSVEEISIESQNIDPNQTIVATNQQLAPDIAQQLSKHNINAIAPQVVIKDPTVDAMKAKFPDHATDGATKVQIDPVTKTETSVEKSFLFKIPHKDSLEMLSFEGRQSQPRQPVDAAPVNPNADPVPGQLRSLGQ